MTGCFGFNMYGVSLDCNSTGPRDFAFTGLRYDHTTGKTNLVVIQDISVAACPALNNCALTPITLISDFENLDSLQISLTVGEQPQIW
jgi:hypothetical protein